jgi:hypothetical protein
MISCGGLNCVTGSCGSTGCPSGDCSKCAPSMYDPAAGDVSPDTDPEDQCEELVTASV